MSELINAGARRQKISNDPNNTQWSNSTDGFGHKILCAQGWTPGSHLNPDAAHSNHFSVASASHIRVLLKDDNLGLGAKQNAGQSVDGQSAGMGSFQDILGRLNGKSQTELFKVQEARADLGRKLYVQQRFGAMRFVKGGLLVGDRVEESRKEDAQEAMSIEEATSHVVPSGTEIDTAAVEDQEHNSDIRGNANETRAERKARKLKRRLRKEARKEAKQKSLMISTKSEISSSDSSAERKEEVTRVEPTTIRRNVRHRFIQQKRMALMNPQSLKEVRYGTTTPFAKMLTSE